MYWHVSGQVVVGIEYFPTLRTRECFLLGLALVLGPRGGWPGLVRGQRLGEAEGGEGGPNPPQLGRVREREHGGEPQRAPGSAASSEDAGSVSGARAVGAGAGRRDQGGEQAGAPGITARPSNYTPLVATSHPVIMEANNILSEDIPLNLTAVLKTKIHFHNTKYSFHIKLQ